ncbi:MAG: hypothetical protein ACI35O_09925, partial [Bacillaceae bacterium]
MDKKNEQHSSLEEQDVLNLPPRSETHADDGKKGKKLKMRHPLIRFLLFCFLLIPIVVFMYTYYGQPVQNEKKGYEIVNVQENKPLATKEPQSEKQTGQKVDKKEQEKK